MSGISQPIDPKCLEIIDEALRRGNPLTPWLQEQELESAFRTGRKDLSRLFDALRNPPSAAVWIQDPTLASYLPVVLRLQDTATDDPGRTESMQRLLIGDSVDRKGRWNPWIYPAVVLGVAIAVAIFLGTTIVPTFKQMFLEFGLSLPPATKWLIWLSDSMLLYPIQSILAVVSLLIMIGLARLGMQWIEARIPSRSIFAWFFSGSRPQVEGMARWTSGLAEMLRLGIPTSEAVALAGRLSGRPSLEMQSTEWEQGESVRNGWFSPVAMSALHCNDPHQQVALLRSLSDLYWNRVLRRTWANVGWIAPIAVVVVGAFVAFVVIALFMPLISLVSSLSS